MMDDEDHEERLAEMGTRFLAALTLKAGGDLDSAEEALRGILRVEPRLPEPHLELGRILLDTDRLAEAEGHAREGLTHLEASGPWTDDLPADVVKSIAHALLAEVLRRRGDEDDVLFGDPDRFHAMVAEAKDHFARAASLDPRDEYSSYYAFFLGAEGHGAPPPELAGLQLAAEPEDGA